MKPRGKLYLAMTVVAVLSVIFAALLYKKITNHSSQDSQTPTSSQNQQSDQQNSENNQRKNDVAAIAGAVAQYGNDNLGAPPTEATAGGNSTLILCSFDCPNKVKSEAKLSYYKPEKVSFRDYTEGLTVPDDQTVYIVHQASCTENEDGLSSGTDISSRASAVLFAISVGSQLQQKCLNV